VKWNDYVSTSEHLLTSQQVPASLEIITLIKKVNPTRLSLDESDRERGYQVKHRLQSLLLEQYGDSFHLIPHPANPGIILIKHRLLPSIDACHADLAALSDQAIDRVESAAPLLPVRENTKRRRKGQLRPGEGLTPRDVLRKGQALLEEYEYAQAEEVLAGLRARDGRDLPVIARAAVLLMEEIGAYQRCVETLLAQPRVVLKDRAIRELLAVAYHHGGCLPEARALLDELYPAELGLDALFAYADIAFKDGNLSVAWELAQLAEGRGFRSELVSLHKEIQAAMAAQAEPLAHQAQTAFRSGNFEEAKRLAREALDSCPGCPQARAIISAIEARESEAHLADLWARLEKETRGELRLTLLSKLLKRDKERRDIVRELFAEEKNRQRQRLFDERLALLRDLVRRECWPDCFDGATRLMRQPEFRQRAGEVLSLSPYFAVLIDNKRLLGSSERSAREPWLRFVKVKLKLAAGRAAGCLETLEELKPWFGSSPEFQKDFLALRTRKQEQARREIALLLDRPETQGSPSLQARKIRGGLKKKLPALPPEERRQLLQIIEERLPESAPQRDPGRALEEYREALQLGHSEKARYLRREIGDPAALEALEGEFAEAFHIGHEPLSLEVSDEIPIDLITAPPLRLSYLTRDHCLLHDGNDSYVIIDWGAMAAFRVTSPVFRWAFPADSTPEGTFLFAGKRGDEENGNLMLRATLSAERAAFTARFDMRQQFEVEEDYLIDSALISSEQETDYYVLTSHAEGLGPAKLQRKRLSPRATLETLPSGKRSKLMVWRWGSSPERFLVSGEDRMWQVNRNLSLKACLIVKPVIYRLDAENGQVYGMENYLLMQRNHRLEPVKCYKNAITLGAFPPERVHGISLQTDTALTVMGSGRQAFYNLLTNKFSQKIRLGRVLPSPGDGKWYCFDFNRKDGKLWLRDITRDIHTLLEWREFFPSQSNPKKGVKQMIWFNEHQNFTYRPDEWGPEVELEDKIGKQIRALPKRQKKHYSL
jgi:hypothetical protein